MKVCLITYTRSPNYGAALQLYATYKSLIKLNCDVSVLCYQNRFESEKSGLKFLLSDNVGVKDKIREYVASYLFGVKRNSRRNFNDFYNEMKHTSPIKSVEELSKFEEFDVFCVGSDQVWNPKITGGFDDVFILNSKLNKKKISFSSSMGSVDFSGYSTESFINSLKEYDHISVREEIAYEYLNSRIPNQITKVVDPTLLLGRDAWNEEIMKKTRGINISDKYVLVYALGGLFEKNRQIASEIAQKIGAKVVAITLSNRPKKVDKIITNATPIDFVQLIRDASFVVTNSFHGTCFSMMMQTPFYSVRFGNNPARAEELLKTYNLDNRLLKENEPINYDLLSKDDLIDAKVNLENNVQKSLTWLKESVYN